MKYTAIGMNHFTWFVEMRCGEVDMMPKLLEIARERSGHKVDADKIGKHFAEAGTADGKLDKDYPFSWQLCNLFGAFPAVFDRHVAEFFGGMFGAPKAYYGKTLGTEVYSMEAVIANGDKIFDQMRKDAMFPGPLRKDYFDQMSGEHEQVTDIIRNIRNDSGAVFSANLPNRGQIPNMPYDAVVECPALASGGTLKAIQQKPVSPAIAGTLATRFQWVETVVDAALEGSRAKFVQALLLDGSVKSIAVAEKLAEDLLIAQKKYLPQFKFPKKA